MYSHEPREHEAPEAVFPIDASWSALFETPRERQERVEAWFIWLDWRTFRVEEILRDVFSRSSSPAATEHERFVDFFADYVRTLCYQHELYSFEDVAMLPAGGHYERLEVDYPRVRIDDFEADMHAVKVLSRRKRLRRLKYLFKRPIPLDDLPPERPPSKSFTTR
jgi:hypothetical protein